MPIIISKKGKETERVNASAFDSEKYLEQYIYDNPDSIPLYDIKDDIKLLILARQFSTNSGPIDAIGVDKDGEIYLVETKLYKNPDKRTVVAQVLDYGASLWRSHGDFNDFTLTLEEDVQKTFKVSLIQRLKDFFDLEDDGASALVENMRINLGEGNFRFVVLMDKLHGQLKDLIVFINQNSKFDIFAVELEYYKYEDYEIMIPKIFGGEVKKDLRVSSSPRNQWDETSFFEDARKQNDERTNQVLTELYEFAKENADVVDWGTGQHKGSFTFKVEHSGSKSGVISLIDLRSNGKIIFRLGNITRRLGKETSAIFLEKLKDLEFLKKWDKEELLKNDWGIQDTIAVVLPDQKSVDALKTGILDFIKEVKK